MRVITANFRQIIRYNRDDSSRFVMEEKYRNDTQFKASRDHDRSIIRNERGNNLYRRKTSCRNNSNNSPSNNRVF